MKFGEGYVMETFGEDVPCNGCVACCKKEVVVLFPEKGDDVSQYDHVEIEVEGVGIRHALRHKNNGDCVYLGESGCTIHDRLPSVCKAFDCRMYLLSMYREERRRHIRMGDSGVNNRREIFKAANKILHTLTPDQIQASLWIRENSTIPKPDQAARDEKRFAGEFRRGMDQLLKKP